MEKLIPHTKHNTIFLTFSMAAMIVLFSTQGFSADWVSSRSNIENGSGNKEFGRYIGGGKVANVNRKTLQQYLSNLNIVGEISDDNINSNTDVNNFTLNIKDSVLTNKVLILAGGSYSGSVGKNNLNISHVEDGYNLDVRAGHSYKGSAKNNQLNITDSVIDQALGGSSRSGIADENKVNIVNSEVRVVHGGRSWFSQHGAKNNQVDVDGSIASWVYGGESQGGEVSGNKVVVRADGDKKSVSRGVIGGKSVSSSKTNVNNNEVEIIGSDIEQSYDDDSGVYGARAAYGNSDSNKVSIRSGGKNRAIIDSNVFGAANEGRNVFGLTSSTANNNAVFIVGALIRGDVYVAKSGGSDTNSGSLIISGDSNYRTQVENIYGGYTMAGSASSNTLLITGSDVNGNIYGGYINDGYEKQASKNNITLSNVNVGGNVYGGYNSGTESNTISNTITLKDEINISGELAGGMAERDSFGGGFGGLDFGRLNGALGFDNNGGISSDVKSDNTLNVYSDHVNVKNVKNFARYHFYLSADTAADANIVNISGNEDTDLTGSQIDISVENGSRLKVGESVNLIKNAQAEILIDDNTSVQASTTGMMTDYVFDIRKGNNSLLKATLRAKKVNSNGKNALNVTALSADVLDKLWYSANDSLANIALNGGESHWISFVNGRGFHTDYNDSDTDMNGALFTVGVAGKVGERLYGGFIEYAKANYHSAKDHVAFDGTEQAYGVGFFTKAQWLQNAYLSGAIRGGRIKTKNHGSDGFNYQRSAPYYSVSIGVGHQVPLGNWRWGNEVDYVYTYIGSDSVAIKGQTVKFKSTDVNRVKVQSQLAHVAGNFQPFLKLKFDYKLNHQTEIIALPDEDGINLKRKGGNVGVEIGFKYAFSPTVQFNAGVSRMVGKQKDTTGKLEMAYTF